MKLITLKGVIIPQSLKIRAIDHWQLNNIPNIRIYIFINMIHQYIFLYTNSIKKAIRTFDKNSQQQMIYLARHKTFTKHNWIPLEGSRVNNYTYFIRVKNQHGNLKKIKTIVIIDSGRVFIRRWQLRTPFAQGPAHNRRFVHTLHRLFV